MKHLIFILLFLGFIPAYGAWQGEKMLQLEGMKQPSAVAVSDAGEIFVLDGTVNQIVVFNKASKQIRTIHTPTDLPMDMLIADNKIMLADTGNHRLLLLSLSGEILQIIELPEREVDCTKQQKKGGECFSNNKKAEPTGISYQTDTLYWSDRRNHRVCQTSLSDKSTNCWGEHGKADKQFRYPFMLVSDRDDYLYVVDVLNARIQVFNYRGKRFGSISAFGLSQGALFRPNGITMDKAGNLFVSGSYRGTISSFKGRKYTGELLDSHGDILRFEQAVGMHYKNNKLYVVEMKKGRVQVFQLREVESQTTQKKQIPKVSRQDCVTCHLEWVDDFKSTNNSETPLVAEQKMCMSCHHGAVIDSRKAMIHGEQHPDYYHPQKDKDFTPASERKTPIDNKLPLLGKSIPYCGTCHTPHAKHENETGIHPDHQNSWMRQDNSQGQLCESCHADHKVNKDKPGENHPIEIHLQKPPKEGGKNNVKNYATEVKLHKGLPKSLKQLGGKTAEAEAMTCESCHLLHGAKGKNLLLKKDTTLCAECHQKQDSKDNKSAHKKGIHPVHVKPEKEMTLKDQKVETVECKSCHDVHGGMAKSPLLQKEKHPNESCEDCHSRQHSSDKKHARKKGVHPVNFKLDKPIKFNNKTINKVECQTCHSVHEGKPNTPLLVSKDANQLCASCHSRQHANDLKQARKKGVHPVNIKLEKPVKVAGEKVEELKCLSCHSVHHGKPNTPALVQEHKNGELCKNCHKSKSAVTYSDHNMQRTAKNSHNLNKETPTQAGVCGSCHSLHKAPKGADKLFIGSGIGPLASKVLKRDRSCFACHRDKGIAKEKQVKLYTHPQRDLVLKSNPKQFPLVDKYGNTKAEGQIACITCHNPHRWMPTGGKRSTIRKGQNEEGNVLNSFLHHKSPQGSFCADCHGIESQIRFKYYHNKRGRPGHADYIK